VWVGSVRARFLKFLLGRGGFKFCGVGADKKFQPAQDSSAHMCMCLLASVENLVMSVTKKGIEERATTVFEKKLPNCSTMLVINILVS